MKPLQLIHIDRRYLLWFRRSSTWMDLMWTIRKLSPTVKTTKRSMVTIPTMMVMKVRAIRHLSNLICIHQFSARMRERQNDFFILQWIPIALPALVLKSYRFFSSLLNCFLKRLKTIDPINKHRVHTHIYTCSYLGLKKQNFFPKKW